MIFQEAQNRISETMTFISMGFGFLFTIGLVKQAIFAIFSYKGGVTEKWWRHTMMLILGGFIGTAAPLLIAFISSGV